MGSKREAPLEALVAVATACAGAGAGAGEVDSERLLEELAELAEIEEIEELAEIEPSLSIITPSN
jgi:hypothetical protein